LRGRGTIAIAKGLENNYSLHTLLLAWNGFGDDGACAVAKALLENNTLEELDLSNNRITKKGCLAFADALKVNTSLKILRIGRNQLGGDGAHALLAAINSNAETGIEILDMDGVVIEQPAQALVNKFLELKPQFDISCTFGKSGKFLTMKFFPKIIAPSPNQLSYRMPMLYSNRRFMRIYFCWRMSSCGKVSLHLVKTEMSTYLTNERQQKPKIALLFFAHVQVVNLGKSWKINTTDDIS
jgi:hypothetical protein